MKERSLSEVKISPPPQSPGVHIIFLKKGFFPGPFFDGRSTVCSLMVFGQLVGFFEWTAAT